MITLYNYLVQKVEYRKPIFKGQGEIFQKKKKKKERKKKTDEKNTRGDCGTDREEAVNDSFLVEYSTVPCFPFFPFLSLLTLHFLNLSSFRHTQHNTTQNSTHTQTSKHKTNNKTQSEKAEVTQHKRETLYSSLQISLHFLCEDYRFVFDSKSFFSLSLLRFCRCCRCGRRLQTVSLSFSSCAE